MKTIKNVIIGLSLAILNFPMIVAAQYEKPDKTNLPESESVYAIVENFMMWILGLVGIIGVIGFAIAGIMYLTASGDEDRINTAKKAMMYSIIGVIVALMGLVVLKAVEGFLGAQNQF